MGCRADASTDPLGCRRVAFGSNRFHPHRAGRRVDDLRWRRLGRGPPRHPFDERRRDHTGLASAPGGTCRGRWVPRTGGHPRRGTHPGGDRHRNRPRPVGTSAGRSRLPGVLGQPARGGPLPRPPPGLRREVRCRRRQTVGRSGAHRPPQPPPDRRGQPRRGGGQGAGPGASEPDLGAQPQHQHAAQCVAGVLPGRVGGLRLAV